MQKCSGIWDYGLRVQVQFDPEDPKAKSRTQQHFAKACNINTIMQKYRKTGLLGDPLMIQKRAAEFRDVSNVPDFQVHLNNVIAIQRAFERLPAIVRSKFNNDPQACIDFMADDSNLAECVELGLRPKADLPAAPASTGNKPGSAEEAAAAAAAAAAGS